jgi:hypothetical protein
MYIFKPSLVSWMRFAKTARKVFDEVTGALRIALADQPARYQFGIRINRGPEPRIASAGVVRCDLWRHVLLLGVAERPALINLHPFALEVLKHPVLVFGAERADFETSRMTVFFATPVMRTVERTELPSIRQLMTLARCSEVSLFILLVCQTAHALSRLLVIFFSHELWS